MKHYYQKRSNTLTKIGLIILLGYLILFVWSFYGHSSNHDSNTGGLLLSPVVSLPVQPREEVKADEPKDEKTLIKEEIRTVFGQDYDRAMKLLTDPRCHENLALDPNAVNDNTTWGGKGQDIGIFQISTYWQGFDNHSVKFLKNYKVNIRIAKQIFDESGSFKMWTCGKYLKI